jgi:hypothetical protein
MDDKIIYTRNDYDLWKYVYRNKDDFWVKYVWKSIKNCDGWSTMRIMSGEQLCFELDKASIKIITEEEAKIWMIE